MTSVALVPGAGDCAGGLRCDPGAKAGVASAVEARSPSASARNCGRSSNGPHSAMCPQCDRGEELVNGS